MKSLWSILPLAVLLLFSVTALAASEEAVERNNIGVGLLQQGNVDAAIAQFQRAITLDSKYFSARLNLAYAFERADTIDEAIAAYREVVNLEPGNNFFARNNLGVLYDKKGQYDLAIVELENALRIEPGNAMALKNLETAKKNQTAVSAREAQILQAERLAQTKPNDPQVSYSLARLYAFYGKKERAYEWLAKARAGLQGHQLSTIRPGSPRHT